MKLKKEDMITVIFGIILVFIVMGIVIILDKTKQTTPPPKPLPTAAPNATPQPTTPALNGRPVLLYDAKAQDKLLTAIENRQTQSQDDRFAKAQILSQLPEGQQSGILFSSPQIQIEYVHSPDLFMVEVLTTDIKSAKDAANVWFRARGLSQKAICTLPVEFYMNYDVANQMRQTNVIFSPLGNGC